MTTNLSPLYLILTLHHLSLSFVDETDPSCLPVMTLFVLIGSVFLNIIGLKVTNHLSSLYSIFPRRFPHLISLTSLQSSCTLMTY
jgi:hypothetical protein